MSSKPAKAKAQTPPGRPQDPESFPSRIAMLEKGDSESKCARISGDKATVTRIKAEMERLRNVVSPAAQRASERTGHSYSVTQGEFRAGNGDVIICLVVTRTD